MNRLLRCQRGSAMVEFALVMPIVLAVVLSTFVFGLAINAKIVVSSAAREGARYMAVVNDPAGARLRVQEAIQGGGLPLQHGADVLFSSGTDVTISFPNPGYVAVTVRYRQPSLVPGLPVLLGGSPWSRFFNLVGRALFRIEWSP